MSSDTTAQPTFGPGREFMHADEIAAQISGEHDLPLEWIEAVFDGLAGLGVDLDRLVRFHDPAPSA